MIFLVLFLSIPFGIEGWEDSFFQTRTKLEKYQYANGVANFGADLDYFIDEKSGEKIVK